jgi:UDP-N-acetylmuramoylalanine--D-glutamate ligase
MLHNTKNISILGAGISGTGAALLGATRGMDVFVSDNETIKPNKKQLFQKHHISFEENGHSFDKILKSDVIIKSPGISENIPLLQKAAVQKIPVIDEIEFASWFTDAEIIAVTGSNGKTTTASLIHHILKTAGKNCSLAGNIGNSFAQAVAEGDYDYFTLEVSSFQLDHCYSFKPHIAVITNITPDHLNRYGQQFHNYAESKFRITRNMTHQDHFIYCLDDTETMNIIQKKSIPAEHHPFSLNIQVPNGAYRDAEQIIINTNNKNNPFIMTIEELALQGRHNVYNSMAAGIATRLVDIRKETIKKCLSDFQNIEHRLESVTQIHGIEFINDSKATNVNSTWYALESINKPVVWIAGGIDKGNDYSKLKPLVAEKVKAIICLGVDNSHLINAFKDTIEEIYETQSIEDAVHWAYRIAHDHEAVLLSPACASFDLFSNYEERGNLFKKYVRSL